MLRSAYALGGLGSGIAENKEKLISIADQVYDYSAKFENLIVFLYY